MAADYLRRRNMTQDEALNYAITSVNAAESWEELKKDWPEISGTLTEQTKLLRLRKETRDKRSTVNIQREKKLVDLYTGIDGRLREYQLRCNHDPLPAQELNRFTADYEELTQKYWLDRASYLEK